MANNITMQKKVNNNYTPYYPKNNAQNVKRTTQEFPYIKGDTLLEMLQGIANTYIAPNGEQWYENTVNQYVTNDSILCGVDNFLCIITPYNEGDLHQLRMLVSYDGGISWYAGHYTNSNTEFRINTLLGAQASLGNNGLYEVVLIGQATSSASEATTYKAQFRKGDSIPLDIYKFTNQINLLGGTL